MTNETVAVTGPERLELAEVVRRIARAADRRVLIVPMPLWFHRLLAQVIERIMKVPLISLAQVKILSEDVSTPPLGTAGPAEDLMPKRQFTVEQIRGSLPDARRIRMRHLRCGRVA